VKKNQTRIIITAVFIILAFYFLYPTYKDYSLSKGFKGLTGEDSIKYLEEHGQDMKSAVSKRLKLGLDLKGGMYVVLDVDVVKLLDEMANQKSKDAVFTSALDELNKLDNSVDQPILKLFIAKLKAQGKSLLSYYGDSRQDEAAVEKDLQDKIDKAIEGAVRTIRSRIDQYGVAEPQIQTVGGKRIIVELPGVSNTEDVKQLLKQTAVLEFRLLQEPTQLEKVIKNINKAVASLNAGDTASLNAKDSSISMSKDSSKITTSAASKDIKKDKTDKKDKKSDSTKVKKDSTVKSKDTAEEKDTNKQLSMEEFQKENPFLSLFDLNALQNYNELMATAANKEKIDRLLKIKQVKDQIPSNFTFAWSEVHKGEGGEYYILYALKDAELTGKSIENAKADIDPQDNKPKVSMVMNNEGANEWARITGSNIGKRCAIVLDGVVYSAPVIQNKITGGRSEISGIPNLQEAKLIEIILRAGSLPAPLRIIEERTIGPSLGEDSIHSGLFSSLLALILVAVFMVVYYRAGGTVSVVALIINVLFVFGIMASFKATLTVPGIAGLILSIGMAVDTNVLIYERIREETRTGKPLKTAVEIGYKKAFSAIIDSHITSLITGVILYNFGSGPIQGFALTLIFGLLSNLFTAIVITHFIFDAMIERDLHIHFG
jgi:preprotein translocase subunit SecD